MSNTDTGKRVVEINGVKMEVDLRSATTQEVNTYKVGDQVKVLIKDYSSWKDYPGTIVGFDNFKQRPTIIIAYLERYNSDIRFAYFNSFFG